MAIYLICGVFLLTFVYVQSKLIVDNFELCDASNNYAIVIEHELKSENGIQILKKGKLTSNIDLDNNIMASIEVYVYEDNTWKFLISFEEQLCSLIHKYSKSIMTEFEKAAKINGTCPYPKGEYKISNFPLEFEKLDYSSIPNGRYKIKIIFKNINNEERLGCINSEITKNS